MNSTAYANQRTKRQGERRDAIEDVPTDSSSTGASTGERPMSTTLVIIASTHRHSIARAGPVADNVSPSRTIPSRPPAVARSMRSSGQAKLKVLVVCDSGDCEATDEYDTGGREEQCEAGARDPGRSGQRPADTLIRTRLIRQVLTAQR